MHEEASPDLVSRAHCKRDGEHYFTYVCCSGFSPIPSSGRLGQVVRHTWLLDDCVLKRTYIHLLLSG